MVIVKQAEIDEIPAHQRRQLIDDSIRVWVGRYHVDSQVELILAIIIRENNGSRFRITILAATDPINALRLAGKQAVPAIHANAVHGVQNRGIRSGINQEIDVIFNPQALNNHSALYVGLILVKVTGDHRIIRRGLVAISFTAKPSLSSPLASTLASTSRMVGPAINVPLPASPTH